jgi:hypothetical protein
VVTFDMSVDTARVPIETRKVLLGHRNGDITTHYSGPELEELIEAANKVCSRSGQQAPALERRALEAFQLREGLLTQAAARTGPEGCRRRRRVGLRGLRAIGRVG